MRPVIKQANNPLYAEPIDLDFSGLKAANQKKINDHFKTLKPTTVACLNALLDTAKIRADGQKPTQGLKDACDVVFDKLVDQYKTAASPLVIELGSYCSYCEIPINGPVQVEHVICKSDFPTFMIAWDNFLLACLACNSKKGPKPSRNDMAGWLGTGVIQKEQDGEKKWRSMHVWPDQGPLSFRRLRPRLYVDLLDDDNWQPADVHKAVDPQAVVVDQCEATHKIWADLPGIGTSISVQVRIECDLNDSEAKAMIELAKLNELGKPNTTSDRRMYYRTLAWFDALGCVAALPFPASHPMLPNKDWTGLIRTAKHAGFFSVWATILKEKQDPFAHGPYVSLAPRFIFDAAKHFPHTDGSHIP